MNNKGFTLLELLAVVFILSILSIMAIVSVTGIVKNSKEELNETQTNSIKLAAESWASDNMEELPLQDECLIITVRNLKNSGILSEDLINIKTNERISDDLKIKITGLMNKKGNINYIYEVNPDDIAECIIYE